MAKKTERVIYKDIEQGSPEWFEIRRGIVSSSRFKDVMSKGRGNAPSKTRESYMKELACEQITGVVQDSYSNEWMERGTLLEAQARSMLELERGIEIEQIGFIKMGEFVGSSTDGITDYQVIEIKCPKHTTHLTYLQDKDELYKTYKHQVQGELWVAEKESAILCSFHPDFPEGKDLIVCEVERDEKFIDEMRESVFDFVGDLNSLVNSINQKEAA